MKMILPGMQCEGECECIQQVLQYMSFFNINILELLLIYPFNWHVYGYHVMQSV